MGIIDLILLAVIGGVTWCVAAEGAVGAGTTFFCALFSGLLAMNFFEPLADLLSGLVGSERADMIALLGLFGGFLMLSRLAAEQLSPTFIPLQGLAYDGGRWAFGFFTGYLLAAIFLTALHTGPFPREFWGFRPERRNLFEVVAPDRQWLGFTQYVTEKSFVRRQTVQDATGGTRQLPRVFDGRTAWHMGLPDRRDAAGGTQPNTDIFFPSFLERYADRRAALGGAPLDLPPDAAGPAGPARAASLGRGP